MKYKTRFDVPVAIILIVAFFALLAVVQCAGSLYPPEPYEPTRYPTTVVHTLVPHPPTRTLIPWPTNTETPTVTPSLTNTTYPTSTPTVTTSTPTVSPTSAVSKTLPPLPLAGMDGTRVKELTATATSTTSTPAAPTPSPQATVTNTPSPSPDSLPSSTPSPESSDEPSGFNCKQFSKGKVEGYDNVYLLTYLCVPAESLLPVPESVGRAD